MATKPFLTDGNIVVDQATISNTGNSIVLPSGSTINGAGIILDATIDTDTINEGATNLYFTSARADARIALQVGGNLDLSAKTTDDLSEGSTNVYYTDARADARVNLQTGANLSLTAKSTDDLSEGSTNLYYTDARSNTAFDTRIATKSTTDLAEGTNLYFTNTRADARISAASITDLSDADQTVQTTDNVTFNNITSTGYLAGPASFTIDPAAVGDNTGTVIIAGDLQVDGTTTTINSTTLDVDDLNITVAKGAANAGAANGAGLTVDGASATFTYHSPSDTWQMNKTLTTNLAGNVTGTVSDISNHNTDALAEGTTNLYFNGKTTTDLTEGTNLYYTNVRTDARIALQVGPNLDLSYKSTDNLSEGSTNLYYTNARADARIAAASIDALTDVDITTSAPTNGQALVWNSSNSEFEPGTVGGQITVQDEGSALSTTATTLNFVGAGVVASGTGATKTITITGGSTNTANSTFRKYTFTAGSSVGTLSGKDDIVVTAGDFTAGFQYEIISTGTTDFTLIGAANSNVGTTFTATGAGSGSGTAGHILNYDTTGIENVEVYVNGIKQVEGSSYDYTATTGTSVVFGTNLQTNDVVDIQVYELLTNINGYYTKTESDNRYLQNVVEDTSPQLGGNLESNTFEIQMADNNKIALGTGERGYLQHTGASGKVQLFSTTGGIDIRTTANDETIAISSDDGSGGIANYIIADGSTGATELYHYGSKKLETTSGGATVTGTVVSDGLTVDTNTLHVDSSNNRIGIGTTSPGYPLNIVGANISSADGLAMLALYDTSTAYNGTNPGAGIAFRSLYTSGGTSTVSTATIQGIKENAIDGNYDTALRFTTRSNGGNLTEKMRIDNAGNVGIGTTSPSEKLHVDGKILSTGITTNDDIVINSSGVHASGCLQINNSSTSNNFPKAIEAYNSGISAGQRHQIMLGKDGSNYDTSTISYYYAGNASTNNRLEFGFWGAGGLLNVQGDGNIGVGIDAPDQKMHLFTDSGTTLYKAEVNANSTVGLEIKKTGSTTQTWRIVDGETVNGALQFYDVTDSRVSMQIDGSGALLVGKTAQNFSNTGTQLNADGRVLATFDGGGPLQLNRLTSHGDIIELHKDDTEVGSIGIESSGFYVDGEGSHAGVKFFLGALGPRQNRADIDSTIDLGWSGGKFKDLYLSGGIQFDARSNKLDDYEEGTFTPTLVSEGANAITVGYGGTPGSQYTVGSYTKVGNTVHFQLTVDVDSYSGGQSSGNSIVVAGLPFTSSSYITLSNGGGPVVYTTGNNTNPSIGIVLGSQTNMRLYRAGAETANQTGDFGASSYLEIAGSYKTDS